MSAGVDVSADSAELVALLRRFQQRGKDLSGTMAIVAEQLVAAVSDEFDTSGQGEWPELAESTIAQRRGTTHQILVDTGRFAGSIQADSGPTWASASTDVDYAMYHVSDAPRSKIPLRNPFDIPDEVLNEATRTIVLALVEGLAS